MFKGCRLILYAANSIHPRLEKPQKGIRMEWMPKEETTTVSFWLNVIFCVILKRQEVWELKNLMVLNKACFAHVYKVKG